MSVVAATLGPWRRRRRSCWSSRRSPWAWCSGSSWAGHARRAWPPGRGRRPRPPGRGPRRGPRSAPPPRRRPRRTPAAWAAAARARAEALAAECADLKERAERDHDVLRALAPVRTTLAQVGEHVAQLERERTEQFTVLAERLHAAQRTDAELRATTASLAG